MNRCFEIQCQFDDTCQSGKCFNGTCLSQQQAFPICNATSTYHFFSDSKMTTDIIDSLNRCSGSICQEDS